jgi:hypothetical protein
MASVGLKKGSPARIFTNVALKEVELPAEEGYSLCETCSKYVAKENLHCAFCDKCPSKVLYFIYTVFKAFICSLSFQAS